MSCRRGDSDFTLQEGGNGTLPPPCPRMASGGGFRGLASVYICSTKAPKKPSKLPLRSAWAARGRTSGRTFRWAPAGTSRDSPRSAYATQTGATLLYWTRWPRGSTTRVEEARTTPPGWGEKRHFPHTITHVFKKCIFQKVPGGPPVQGDGGACAHQLRDIETRSLAFLKNRFDSFFLGNRDCYVNQCEGCSEGKKGENCKGGGGGERGKSAFFSVAVVFVTIANGFNHYFY